MNDNEPTVPGIPSAEERNADAEQAAADAVKAIQNTEKSKHDLAVPPVVLSDDTRDDVAALISRTTGPHGFRLRV